MARRTSAHGVGESESAASEAAESRTYGCSNWPTVSLISRRNGTTVPPSVSIARGQDLTRTGATPAARQTPATASAWDTGGLVGACQTRPCAAGVVAAVTRAVAMSRTSVKECRASGSPKTRTARPRSARGTTTGTCAWLTPGPR
ncbi:hypothetical protein ENKNEFLB_03135 [Nocardioides aquaticus]|uniref:Uncharacterized protein n=1 Tax=Nocardioides aquaticus TaxID=160826 RepID=A0ABX8ELP0_9ACTN|nr:hypothetical protein ENKNEFLB_03135 [Nocardioides aquaticus]